MTSSDLNMAISSMQKHLVLRVILLDTVEVSKGDAASRIQTLVSAVRPANAMDVVVLFQNGVPGSNSALPA